MALTPWRASTRTSLLSLALLLLGGVAQAQDDDSYAPDPPDRAARLALIRGDVSLQPAGETEWAPAQLNRPLTTGDKLWTGRDARAEVQVGQAAVRLDNDTGFSFLDLGDDTIQMRMTAGTLILDVRELAGREHIEIDTPNVALSILRPGSYRVEVNDAGDVTTVKVSEGEAEASGPGQNVIVNSRQVVTFRGLDTVVADWSTLGSPDEFDDWSLDRKQRLERLASSRTSQYVSPEVTGYGDLEEHGTWSSEPEYGYVWTPRHVVVGWSPYRYGRWSYIGPWGWTWIDDSPWGYAPFHYGRWAHIRHRWCWVPGPRHVRPVFAPALVGWVGLRGSYVSWVPLGPRDVYRPWRRFSRHYVERVNFANARHVERAQVRQAVERRIEDSLLRNRSVPDAVTAVPRTAFTGAERVGDRRVRFDERLMAGGQDNAPRLAPGRESRLGGAVRANPRIPESVIARQVVTRREPPATGARFARRFPSQNEVTQPAPSRPGRPQEQVVRPETDRPTSVRDALARHREDRPDRPTRVDRPDVENAPVTQPERVERDSVGERLRDYRERSGNEMPRQERVEQRDDSRRESLQDRYPQHTQRPHRTQDDVREAVARQLERQRQEQPRSESRAERRMEQPRMEQPRSERRQEQPRSEQPRPTPRSYEPPKESREQPRAEQPRARQQDGNRHQRH